MAVFQVAFPSPVAFQFQVARQVGYSVVFRAERRRSASLSGDSERMVATWDDSSKDCDRQTVSKNLRRLARRRLELRPLDHLVQTDHMAPRKRLTRQRLSLSF